MQSRGKEAHLTHEEIVSCMKWKLAMGKYQKKLKDLIQMNTPRVVMTETKKAFRNLDKRNDLEAAILALRWAHTMMNMLINVYKYLFKFQQPKGRRPGLRELRAGGLQTGQGPLHVGGGAVLYCTVMLYTILYCNVI